MTILILLLHNPLVRGAITGLCAAAVVDVHAFLSWKKVDDAYTYEWRTALLRWTQGAMMGALTGAGFNL